jgi:hypothetical protein
MADSKEVPLYGRRTDRSGWPGSATRPCCSGASAAVAGAQSQPDPGLHSIEARVVQVLHDEWAAQARHAAEMKRVADDLVRLTSSAHDQADEKRTVLVKAYFALITAIEPSWQKMWVDEALRDATGKQLYEKWLGRIGCDLLRDVLLHDKKK